MILSEHFVFLHLPKTGGSFVRELCTHYAPPAWKVRLLDHHPTIHDIPSEYANLPIFGFVRNPFDWYVSWYTYLRKRRRLLRAWPAAGAGLLAVIFGLAGWLYWSAPMLINPFEVLRRIDADALEASTLTTMALSLIHI